MEKTVTNSVKREIIVNAPLEKVWEALTVPEHLNRWYTKKANIDFRVGGKGEMEHGWGSKSEGIFTEIIHLEKFTLESPNGDFKTITHLEELQDGVKVTIEYIVQFMGEEGKATEENMLYGTYQFLKNLKSVMESSLDIRTKMWKSWLGIMHVSSNRIDPSLTHGCKVIKVVPGSPAHEAGILPGDIITHIEEDLVDGYDSLETIINGRNENSLVHLTVKRSTTTISLPCKVAAYPVPY